MYGKSAGLYDKLSDGFADYPAMGAKLAATMRAAHPHARTLLEVASGTGRYLEVLREHYQVEGLEISAQMLQIARERLPDLPMQQGDMISFQLGRAFDIVACLYGSIAYVRTEDNLRRAIRAMRAHLAPGGILVVEPFFGPDNFWLDRVTMNTIDEPDFKASWIYVSKRQGSEARLQYHYTVGRPQGVEHFTELHELGLFSPQQYESAFADAGLKAMHDAEGPARRGLYVARSAKAPG